MDSVLNQTSSFIERQKKTRSLIATTTTTILLFTCSRFICFSLRCLNRESHSRPHSISMRVLFLSLFLQIKFEHFFSFSKFYDFQTLLIAGIV